MLTCSVFDWKYPFRANFVWKVQIISLSWNLVHRLIRICRIQWWFSLFSVLDFFMHVFIQKIHLVLWYYQINLPADCSTNSEDHCQRKRSYITLTIVLEFVDRNTSFKWIYKHSSRLRIHESIVMTLFMRHLRRSVREVLAAQKKWVVDSGSRQQERSGFIVSWKWRLNLCSLRWLKSERNPVRNLIPRLSETLNKLLGESLINFSNE